MRTYNVYLWSGIGYCLTPFKNIEAYSELHAVEIVTAQLIKDNDIAFYLTLDEMEEARSEGYVFELDPENDEIEGWCYIDATMEGANAPVWLRTENMRIELAA